MDQTTEATMIHARGTSEIAEEVARGTDGHPAILTATASGTENSTIEGGENHLPQQDEDRSTSMTEKGMIGDMTGGTLPLAIVGTRGHHLRVAAVRLFSPCFPIYPFAHTYTILDSNNRYADHYSGRARSPPRHPPPRIPSPSRAIRSPSPRRRSIKLDPDEPHHARYDRDRIRERGSPRRYSRSPSPAHQRRLPRRSRSRSRTRWEGPRARSRSPPRPRSPSPARCIKQEPVDDVHLGEARHPEEHPTSSPLSHVKKEEEREEKVEWRRRAPSPRREVKKESPSELAHARRRFRSPSPVPIHPRARARSPSLSVSERESERERERQREHQQEREREKEKKPTQPFLPPIPRYEPRPNFSTTLAHEAEYARLDAHRANVSAEHRKTGKAWRRALHELDMATLELRAAQHRRELAETLRKRAHAGVLGIDATVAVGTAQGSSSATA
ncbi:hypothetical protein EDD15DRAFT_2375990 [Pisolithus albus]|nr:hypothetical protein EDD15DRAFT_2375990 [Pisolithus albus]